MRAATDQILLPVSLKQTSRRTGLAFPDLLVEIDAIALIGTSK